MQAEKKNLRAGSTKDGRNGKKGNGISRKGTKSYLAERKRGGTSPRKTMPERRETTGRRSSVLNHRETSVFPKITLIENHVRIYAKTRGENSAR